MGFAVPAAIGAKLARPDTPVVCIVGDGDFMMTMQELALCAMHDLPVTFVILNNRGFISIRDGQHHLMGRQVGSEFNRTSGPEYSVDFAALAKACGIPNATTVSSPNGLSDALRRAVESNEPALVETLITRDASIAAAEVVGWWDFPLLPSAPRRPTRTMRWRSARNSTSDGQRRLTGSRFRWRRITSPTRR